MEKKKFFSIVDKVGHVSTIDWSIDWRSRKNRRNGVRCRLWGRHRTRIQPQVLHLVAGRRRIHGWGLVRMGVLLTFNLDRLSD